MSDESKIDKHGYPISQITGEHRLQTNEEKAVIPNRDYRMEKVRRAAQYLAEQRAAEQAADEVILAQQHEQAVKSLMVNAPHKTNREVPPQLAAHRFKSGADNPNYGGGSHTGYGAFLKKLSPLEREAHLALRRAKRNLRATIEERIALDQDKWATALEMGAARVLERAVTEGDPNALNSVWDRVIGKPKQEVSVTTSDREDELDDVLAQLHQSMEDTPDASKD